jgi:hypothetical protein
VKRNGLLPFGLLAAGVLGACVTCQAQVFVLEGDHFVQVQKLLQQAYGKPDEAIHSSAPAGGHCCSMNYAPAQIGVFLNLTRAFDDWTIVSILGAQKP